MLRRWPGPLFPLGDHQSPCEVTNPCRNNRQTTPSPIATSQGVTSFGATTARRQRAAITGTELRLAVKGGSRNRFHRQFTYGALSRTFGAVRLMMPLTTAL